MPDQILASSTTAHAKGSSSMSVKLVEASYYTMLCLRLPLWDVISRGTRLLVSEGRFGYFIFSEVLVRAWTGSVCFLDLKCFSSKENRGLFLLQEVGEVVN